MLAHIVKWRQRVRLRDICLLALLLMLSAFTAGLATAAGATTENDYCHSRTVLGWIESTNKEASGIIGDAILLKPSIETIVDGERVLQMDPIIEKQIKQEEAKPYELNSRSIMFIFPPKTLGVHVKTGVHTCSTNVWILEPKEDRFTGKVVMTEKPGWEIADSNNYYVVLPRDQMGRTLICLARSLETLPPNVTDFEDLIEHIGKDKRALVKTFSSVTGYVERFNNSVRGYGIVQ